MQFQEIFRKIGSRELEECHGTGVCYEHTGTGARIFTLKNEDPNKVFMIGFRTIPQDSTGVAHILEHSVLCGSEKFPLKDPFVELAKGSLNTFLNAMTYPDKTVYPVASCNDRDFMNLMDVYLDAVFHPNIYREEKIFRQEGWHYETDPEGNLTVNGVVYNEMKGVYSSPDSVLERYTLNSLFPHTTYAFESGGDPECIPDLSYEEFLQFHRDYYHPSNSYIYLCGDMDMEEKLLWIHEKYLSGYARLEIDSSIAPEPSFESPVYAQKEYSVISREEERNRTYLSENYVIPGVQDSLTDLAWEIIDFVLLGAPGAPLKEELMERGFGEEIYGGYNAGILQPYFSVIAKNTEIDKRDEFRNAVQEILTRIVREGFDRTSLAAALNYMEFKYREEDFGRTPAGLEYGLNAMESWLYDREPWVFLTYNKEFRILNEKIGTGFYEKLLSEAVLNNPHAAEVVVVPKAGLAEEKEQEQNGKLRKYKQEIGTEEFRNIEAEAEELKRWQEEPDGEEQKKCLPVLGLEDIGREAEKNAVRIADNVIYSEIPTNGVAYVRLIFHTSQFTEQELQQAALLKNLYGELNTRQHSFKELTDEILLKTGGLDFSVGSYSLDHRVRQQNPFFTQFSAELRSLSGRIGEGIGLIREIMSETDFSDEKRIREKLTEMRSQAKSGIEEASHMAAILRAASYESAQDRCSDLLGGIAWYDYLNECVRKMKTREGRKEFLSGLQATAEKICACAFDTALSGDREMLRELNLSLSETGGFVRRDIATEGKGTACTTVQPISQRNEGIITGSMVNYVARTGCYLAEGERYSGAIEVLKILLNYEYLWINLRVKGGAYGCMSMFRLGGRAIFVSYRDPNLEETDRIYRELPEWLAGADISEENVLKYIIGAIAALDQPVTASVKALRQLGYYYTGITDEELAAKRADILGCTPEVLKAFAPNLARMMEENSICVIGNKEKIKAGADMFGTIREIRGEA